MKNTIRNFISVCMLIFFSACSSDGDKFEVTFDKPVENEEALVNKISDDLLVYMDYGINNAIDDELSVTNYFYLLYSYVHSMFSNEDLIAEQFAENLNENINKEGMLAIVDTNVKLYKQQKNIKPIAGNEIKILRNKISNSNSNLEKDTSLKEIKKAVSVELTDIAMDMGEWILGILLTLCVINAINTKIQAKQKEQIENLKSAFNGVKKAKGFIGKGIMALAGICGTYSNSKEIERLEKKKEMYQTGMLILNIAIIIISVFILSDRSVEIQNSTKDNLAETYVNIIVNASEEVPLINKQ